MWTRDNAWHRCHIIIVIIADCSVSVLSQQLPSGRICTMTVSRGEFQNIWTAKLSHLWKWNKTKPFFFFYTKVAKARLLKGPQKADVGAICGHPLPHTVKQTSHIHVKVKWVNVFCRLSAASVKMPSSAEKIATTATSSWTSLLAARISFIITCLFVSDLVMGCDISHFVQF